MYVTQISHLSLLLSILSSVYLDLLLVPFLLCFFSSMLPLSLFSPSSAELAANAVFSQKNVKGTITFEQAMPSSTTYINISLTGLPSSELYQWHVHQYPFTAALSSPCSPANTGGHFDPLGASTLPNYSTNCNPSNVTACEIGDLSGKFGLLNASNLPDQLLDDTLSLYGAQSIVGRSIVLHFQNGTRFVCANILPNSSESIIGRSYVPFRRSNIVGDMYFTQYSFNVTTVFVNLLSSLPTTGHNWHVHELPITGSDGDNPCTSTGGHYNPRGVNVSSSDYPSNCNGSNPLECEVGDLSSKGGVISFSSSTNQGRLFYVDTDLPLLPDGEGHYIANRSVVIHQEGRGPGRIACGNVTELRPREAVVVFNGVEGVTGTIRFKQASPYDPTTISVDIRGLSGMAGGYHVHEMPVGEGVSGRGRCGPRYTGGHWNPTGAPYPLPTGLTYDQYEIGDLSGKFGLLTNLSELIAEYSDPDLPLFGTNSIMGRSVVIHLSQPGAPRWVCANIDYATPTVRVSAAFPFANFQRVEVVFVQPENDAYADTTIYVRNNSFIESSLSPSPSLTSQSSSSIILSSFFSSPSQPSTSLSTSADFSMFSTLSPSPSPSPSPSMLGSGDDGGMMLRKRRFSGSDLMNDLLEDKDIFSDEFLDEGEEHRILVAKRQVMNMLSLTWSVSNVPSEGQGPVSCSSIMTTLSNTK